MRRYLLLFDIDGTLLHAAGAGRDAIHRAMTRVYREVGPIDELQFAGMTDPAIVRTLLRAAGWPDPEIDAGLPELWSEYEQCLSEELGQGRPGVGTCAGVPELLTELERRPEFELALLTGNVEPGAWLKLSACGLANWFRYGAFGSDAEVRDELPAVALRRAAEFAAIDFEPAACVVIGDTPADVQCARAGSMAMLGVGTGDFEPRQLLDRGAGDVVDDLADADAVIRRLRTLVV